MYKLIFAGYTDGDWAFKHNFMLGRTEEETSNNYKIKYELTGLDFSGDYDDYRYNDYEQCFNFEFSHRSLSSAIKFLNNLKEDLVMSRMFDEAAKEEFYRMFDEGIDYLNSGNYGISYSTITYDNWQPTSLIIIHDDSKESEDNIFKQVEEKYENVTEHGKELLKEE